MFSVNKGSFILSFPVYFYIPFLPLAWTSSMMLNSSGKMRHPYIVPDFRGETSSFSAINMKAVNLLVVFFMKLRKFPLIQVCWEFVLWMDDGFFFYMFWYDHMIFQFFLLLWSVCLFSHSVVSDSLGPHGLQHARLPCLSPSPGACSNSCPLSWWCRPNSLSSVDFFSCLQSFPSIRVFSN